MANKPTKPINVVPSATPSKEELAIKRMQFFANRRENFAVNILCNLVQGAITNKDCTNVDCKRLVDISVEMADRLLEQLYPSPKPEEEKK